MSPERGLVDTSVAIVLEHLDAARLPGSVAISSLTLAELSSGPAATTDIAEKARRQSHLQGIEAGIEVLDFDSVCARAYGQLYAGVRALGRKARGTRSVDLMIAATARAHELPLYTLNAVDLRGAESLVEIVDLSA